MNFQRGRQREPLEINFIPLIDVLIVILIFLMITTTYRKYTELQINAADGAGRQAARAAERDRVLRERPGPATSSTATRCRSRAWSSSPRSCAAPAAR